MRAAVLALPDAGGYAEAAIGGAGEGQPVGVGREVTVRLVDALEVTGSVLGK